MNFQTVMQHIAWIKYELKLNFNTKITIYLNFFGSFAICTTYKNTRQRMIVTTIIICYKTNINSTNECKTIICNNEKVNYNLILENEQSH